MIDSGGGTVDLGVYQVSYSEPLTLVGEEVELSGKCPAGFRIPFLIQFSFRRRMRLEPCQH